ncbi:MAG TPA: glycosyltransferase family 4 protein [Longimicrobiales bacterium]|nr:glycosyltransferase family 4 protein [Longimicrobiales bacterium]
MTALRVAYLTSEYGDIGQQRGGLGSHLARTVPLVAAAGARCDVFLCSGSRGDTARETIVVDGVNVHRIAGSHETPFDDLLVPAQVRRHLRSAWLLADALGSPQTPAFDVVQVPNIGVAGLFADVRVPMAMRFSSHAATWHAASGAQRDARTVLGEILQRRAIDRAVAHFAPSRFVAALVSEETGIPVDVIRPPMPSVEDDARWDTEWAASAAGGGPYVVHAGQLGAAKGTDLVIAAAEIAMTGGARLRFHFCGPDAGAGARIARLERRFPDRVQYHGRLPASRLHPLMGGAHAVLCPSRADNLPNVAIEAMALGTPVIGTRGASIDELVNDGESGVLVPLEATALAEAIARLVSLPADDLARMRRAARDKVSEALDPGRQIRALLDFYGSVAGRPVPEPRPRLAMAKQIRADLIALQPWFENDGSRSRARTRLFGNLPKHWRRRTP